MSIFSKIFGSKRNSNKLQEQQDIIIEDPIIFDGPILEDKELASTPDNLPDAIRYVIDKWNKDYLLNRGFINILNDLKVLKDLPAAKHIITNMQTNGYIEKITMIKNWDLESKSISIKYADEFGAREDLVDYIVRCFGYGLGKISDLPKLKGASEQEQKPFNDPTSQTISIPSSTTYRQPSPNPISKPTPQPVPQQLGPYDPKMDLTNYHYPTLDLLKKYEHPYIDMQEQTANKNHIVDVLRNFGIEISSIKATVGPRISLYEITLAPGINVSRLRGLEDDIALALCSHNVKIVPIPSRGTIGITVPNARPIIVSMESIINTRKFQESTMELPCAIGKTITNEVFMFDLAKAPHLLVAGSTGQGKSVLLNAIIISLLYKKHPAELKLVLMDSYGLEFSPYISIANHFLASIPNEPIIVSNSDQAVNMLNSLCEEMSCRYDLLKKAQVNNALEYNHKIINRHLNPAVGHKYMPYIVVIIDEYGSFVEDRGRDIETPITQLAQSARIVGIHLIISTKRPTNDIITQKIKTNIPTRISFRVPERIDSQTILDCNGAEELLGDGDMLYRAGKTIDCIRVQGVFVDIQEIGNITHYILHQQSYLSPYELPDPNYEETIKNDVDMQHLDPMFEDAARLIVREQSGSTSLIQRKFAIGYNRAGHLMDQLEKAGIVGAAHGSKPREVLIMDEMSLEKLFRCWGL